VLDGLKTFKLRFLDSNRQWQDNWPVQDPSTGAKSLALPAGLELTIEHDRFGTLERLFVLTDFDASKAQVSLNRSVESGSNDSATEDETSVSEGGQ